MASETNLLIVAAHGLRKLAHSALENVFAFFLPLFGLSMLGTGMRSVADQLDRHSHPAVALAFICICALVWLGLLSLVTPASVRGADGRIRGGMVVGFVAAAALVWVYIFALFSYLLFKLGAVTFVIKQHPDAPLSDLLDAYLWYLFDLIPVLHVNNALGWTADVDLNGGVRGVILLLFRVVIVFQVFALAKRLLQAREQGLADSK